MATNNQYRAFAQLTSLEAGASNRGEEYSASDIAFILEFSDETALELARALGRTEYGIENVRQKLLAGENVGGGAKRVQPRAQRTYTFIGDDVPADW